MRKNQETAVVRARVEMKGTEPMVIRTITVPLKSARLSVSKLAELCSISSRFLSSQRAFVPLDHVSAFSVLDDEVQLGAALLADEPQPGTRIERASCFDPRVGVTHSGREITVDLRAAGLPGGFRKHVIMIW